jgi:hypothetical protein
MQPLKIREAVPADRTAQHPADDAVDASSTEPIRVMEATLDTAA